MQGVSSLVQRSILRLSIICRENETYEMKRYTVVDSFKILVIGSHLPSIFLHRTSTLEEEGGVAGGPCLVLVLESAVTVSFPLPSPSAVSGFVSPETGRESRPPLPTPFSSGTC